MPLQFWWHYAFDERITSRTLLFLKNNKDEMLFSINCLEYLRVIVSYCAAYTVTTPKNPTADLFPVILDITDNTSALNWMLHTAKKSLIGRALARFFCGLLIGYPLGINLKRISTHDK